MGGEKTERIRYIYGGSTNGPLIEFIPRKKKGPGGETSPKMVRKKKKKGKQKRKVAHGVHQKGAPEHDPWGE